MFINLKPLDEREGLPTARIVDRMRRAMSQVRGLNVFMVPAQDIRVGARQGKAQYQLTLWSPDFEDLYQWAPRVVDRLRREPGLSMCPRTASRAACRPTSPLTGSPHHGLASEPRISTTP